jgi:F420H(2)-dependent quinone reductase
MAEAKLAPNLSQWMIDHGNRYISSGGTEGHLYTVTPPGYSEITVPSLLLTTTGRKSGEKFIFPLFYSETGNSYIMVASKGVRQSTRAGIGIFSPILRSRFRLGRRSSRHEPGPLPVQSARSCGKRP